MHTRYEGDIKRVRERHGAAVSKLISRLPTGLGLIECADYNKGSPYFLEFRPLLHSPYKLTENEVKTLVKKETPVLRGDVVMQHASSEHARSGGHHTQHKKKHK